MKKIIPLLPLIITTLVVANSSSLYGHERACDNQETRHSSHQEAKDAAHILTSHNLQYAPEASKAFVSITHFNNCISKIANRLPDDFEDLGKVANMHQQSLKNVAKVQNDLEESGDIRKQYGHPEDPILIQSQELFDGETATVVETTRELVHLLKQEQVSPLAYTAVMSFITHLFQATCEIEKGLSADVANVKKYPTRWQGYHESYFNQKSYEALLKADLEKIKAASMN